MVDSVETEGTIDYGLFFDNEETDPKRMRNEQVDQTIVGSMMSSAAEAQALLIDTATKTLFSSLKTGKTSTPALQALLTQLEKDQQSYQNSLSTKDKKTLGKQLQTDLSNIHDFILSQLTLAIQTASKDPTRPIGKINGDFTDPNDLKFHIQTLQNLAYQIDTVQLGNIIHPAIQGDNNQMEDSTLDTLITKGASPWTVSGSITPTKNGGPFGYDNSIAINSGGSVQQSFTSEADKQYVVAVYMKCSSQNGIGKIDITGLQNVNSGHYEDWTNGSGPDGKTPQWHLVYYRVRTDQASKITVNFHTDNGTGNSMKISSPQLLIYDGTTSMDVINKNVQSLYSFPNLSGPVQKGAFPQHKTAWMPNDSFIPSYSSTNGVPDKDWWDFSGAQIVNGQNGTMWADLEPTTGVSAKTVGKSQTLLPTTLSDTYHFHAVLRNPGGKLPPSPSITLTAVDNSVTPQKKYTYQVPIPQSELSDFKAGNMITIDQNFSAPDFKGLPAGNYVQLFVELSGYKGSGGFQAANVAITTDSTSTTKKINDNWFYNENDPFANTSSKFDNHLESTDFTKGETGRWDKVIAGNDDLNPDANFKPVIGTGLPLQGNYNSDGTYKTQGIVFPHPLGACGRGWEVTTTFTVQPPNPEHKPVIAIWAYGNAEPSGWSPLNHINGGADSMVNEVDMEIGDLGPDQTSQVVYSGKTEGGKSHVTFYPKLPFDVYDGGVYTASLKATRAASAMVDGIKTIPLMTFEWSITQVEDSKGTKTGITKDVGNPITVPFNGVVNSVVSTEQMKTTDKKVGNTTVILKSNTAQSIGSALSANDYPELAKPSDTDYGEGTPSTGFQGCPFKDLS